MRDITKYLGKDIFTRPKGTNAFINNNLDELYKLFNEIVSKDGVVNLRYIGDAIANVYGDYDASEARTRLYKATDEASQNYGLSTIKLEDALKLAYPDLEGFQIVNGIAKAGRGQINLTRFLYKEQPRLTEFMMAYSERVKFNDKKFPVINVEKMFK